MAQKERISEEETRALQSCLLQILVAIDDVCRRHHLTYYLIAGSMLGAIRHQGFVPWDDDADIAMPRKDYETFIAHANEWLPESFELISGRQHPRYPYAFARVQDRRTTYILRRSFDFVGGLPVDVFPLDGMTTKRWKQRWHYLRYGLTKTLLYYALRDPLKHGKGFGYYFISLCHRLLSPERLHQRLDRLQQEFDYTQASLVADHDNAPERGILPKAVYGMPQRVEFAGVRLNGVAQPDLYLKYCYGNYWELPKQLPPQNFKYLNLHQPYTQYSPQK